MSRYLFIDGASLQETMAHYKDTLYAGAELQVDYSVMSSGFSKIYYYDCLPAKLDGEADAAYDLRCKGQQDLFDHLHTLDGWHVSQGVAKRSGRKRPAQQKEVDILIAVDMLANTFRKSLSELTFITSDLDFRPLLEEVGRWGVHTTLLYQPGHASMDLVHAADARKPISAVQHHAWLTSNLRGQYPMPNRAMIDRPLRNMPLEILDEAVDAKLYDLQGSFALIFKIESSTVHKYEQWTHRDGEFLKRFWRLYRPC